jgi:hypothetical protein
MPLVLIPLVMVSGKDLCLRVRLIWHNLWIGFFP